MEEIKNGKYTYNFSNGQVRYVDNYVNGEKHGECVEYYSNGQLRYVDNYVNGKEHGKCIGYYENGPIRHNQNYVNGKHHGECIYYYENGRVMRINHFENGKICGQQKKYEQIILCNSEIYYTSVDATCNNNHIIKGYCIYEGQLEIGDIFQCDNLLYKIVRGYIFNNGYKIKKSSNLLVKLVNWKLKKTDIESIDNTKELINISTYTLEDNGLNNSIKFVPINQFTITPMNDATLTIKWKTPEERDKEFKEVTEQFLL